MKILFRSIFRRNIVFSAFILILSSCKETEIGIHTYNMRNFQGEAGDVNASLKNHATFTKMYNDFSVIQKEYIEDGENTSEEYIDAMEEVADIILFNARNFLTNLPPFITENQEDRSKVVNEVKEKSVEFLDRFGMRSDVLTLFNASIYCDIKKQVTQIRTSFERAVNNDNFRFPDVARWKENLNAFYQKISKVESFLQLNSQGSDEIDYQPLHQLSFTTEGKVRKSFSLKEELELFVKNAKKYALGFCSSEEEKNRYIRGFFNVYLQACFPVLSDMKSRPLAGGDQVIRIIESDELNQAQKQIELVGIILNCFIPPLFSQD